MADPTVSNVYQTSIPQELLPYAKTMLDTASQYTDIAKNPYQQYQGERVAQLSPLTQQAMETAGQMQVPGQIGAASDIAGIAGLGALQQNTFANPYAAGAYMSPFMQNVVDVQQQQARRQAAIQNQAQQAQATQAGAFGGGRDAIMRAQANAELQRNLQGIQATGLQNAFQNAQQQFNAEQQQRMQGLQTGLQAASTLGGLGAQQAQQQQQIIGTQAQLGQAAQQRAQDVLNAQYQDFLNYQNYPYKQLGFMSDLIRGTPTTQSAATMYQAPPTMMQNLMSLGLGAYGINQLTKAEGGSVHSYAKGGLAAAYAPGGSVMSPEFKRYAVDHIDPRQLPIAQRNAMARGDSETADFAQDEMALDAAIRRGIGAAFTPEMADHVVRAAGGGILAFKAPTAANNYGTTSSEGADNATDDADEEGVQEGITQVASPGNPRLHQAFGDRLNRVIDRMEAAKGYVPLTAQERRQAENTALTELRTAAGPDIYGPALSALDTQDTERAAALEQGKGLAALEAAGAVLEPGGTMRGLGSAGRAFSKSYGQALAADRAEKRYLGQMRFGYNEARRKENAGLFREARQDVQNAEANRYNAVRAANQRDQAIANALGKGIQATRPVGGAGAGAGKERDQAQAMRVYGAEISRQFPDMPPEQVQSQALQMYLSQKGAGLPGVEARTEAGSQKDARTSFNNRLSYGVDARAKAYRAADKAGKTEDRERLRAEIAAEEGYKLPNVTPLVTPVDVSEPPPAAPATKPAAAKPSTSTKAPDISTVKGAPAGATIGAFVQGQGYEVKDSKGKLIGYAKGS